MEQGSLPEHVSDDECVFRGVPIHRYNLVERRLCSMSFKESKKKGAPSVDRNFKRADSDCIAALLNSPKRFVAVLKVESGKVRSRGGYIKHLPVTHLVENNYHCEIRNTPDTEWLNDKIAEGIFKDSVVVYEHVEIGKLIDEFLESS